MLKKQKVAAYKLWKAAGSPREDSNVLWRNHKDAKRVFRCAIKRVQRNFEQREVDKLVEAAKMDKNKFWKILKRKRNQSEAVAIKNKDGTIEYEIHSVVQAWKEHFRSLSAFDRDRVNDWEHHVKVSNEVQEWCRLNDDGTIFNNPLTTDEMETAVRTLNSGKSPGFDEITSEHIKCAGGELVEMLTRLYNRIIVTEYIPKNFRTGTQIPLYKGKNLCSLDPNSFRGITLLTSFNKLFEIVTWNTITWEDHNVISPLQGACLKGSSCLHTAAILQEAIAVGLGTSKRVFVAYFDVAQAFDSVWTDGLFFQLRKKGLVGKEWRLL